MEHRDNPYTPGAGTTPPALLGRTDELGSFEDLIYRLENGRSEQSQIITGLRGVGKTVLLNSFRTTAEEKNWAAVDMEIDATTQFSEVMARHARKALYALDAPKRWGARMRKAAEVLRSFNLTVNPDLSVTLGVDNDIEPAAGSADSGVLSEDLSDLLVALGEAAKEKGRGVVFLVDEIQFLSKTEFTALILALHKVGQRNLPVTLVGAGLPQLPKLAGDARSYAERLFEWPRIGGLDDNDARAALSGPAAKLGVTWDDGALSLAVEYTEGYPYFLQEVGSAAWKMGLNQKIKLGDVQDAIADVEQRLDAGFFRVRVDRCTDLELAYLRAMAELGSEPQKAFDIATKLGYKQSEQLGTVRANLIAKGLIYTTSHGYASFTVPQFDKFLKRLMDFQTRTPKARAKRKA